MGLRLSSLALVFFLTACGEKETYIAEKVEMNVQFSNKLVSVAFTLAKALQIPANARISFSTDRAQLSLLSIRTEGESPTRLSTVFSAATIGSEQWPVELITHMPNLEKLPKTVPSGGLKRWAIKNDEITFLSLFQHEPRLITGGAIVSKEFQFLPLGFFATQYFRDEFGTPTGSISLLGPTPLDPGGVYFLGNFDLNPFFIVDSGAMSMQFKATEPAQILSQGVGNIDYFSIPRHLNFLARDLESFR